MALSQLVKRELRVFLKSPGYIATLIILAVFYSILGNLIGETIKIGAEASEAGICVVFEENSNVVTTLANLLNKSFNGKVYTCSSLQEAISRCSIGVAIPRGQKLCLWCFGLFESF